MKFPKPLDFTILFFFTFKFFAFFIIERGSELGNGATVKSGATVTACYIGALADTGVIFDTADAHGGPQTFSLGQVIAGWQVGIPGMKVGGTRELLIPSAMGYGTQGSGAIPPNADLIFIVSVESTK